MKNLFSLLLVVIIGTCTATFSQTVTIGTQEWMTRNLDVTTFRNGDPIPEAKTDEEWKKAGELKQPAWCYYNNNSKYKKKYGKLYNWYAVNDSRGLAPLGYHVPTNEEYKVLIDFLGGESVAGGKLKSTCSWYRYEGKIGNGTNSSGFTGRPGGKRDGYIFGFSDRRWAGYFWSSTEFKTNGSYRISITNSSNKVVLKFCFKEDGLSVRCLRD
jgi:uncharacterized protein (TIGR02145 family)